MDAWLTNGAFLLAWAAGIFIIFWTLVKDIPNETGTSADINILGTKISIKGRTAFQIFLGASLLILPVFVANVVHAQVTPEPTSVQTVDRIADPDHQAFIFLRDLSILDLRGSLAQKYLTWIPFWKKGKTDPAILMNSMLIKKISSADTIAFTYATSGKLAARCLTQKCTIRRATMADQHAAGKLTETWELTADVRDFSVGQEFSMLVEVTYWDAFDTAAKQWYSTYSNSQDEPENISVLLLFPENKPFRDTTRLAYPHGSNTGAAFQGNERVIPGDGNRSLYWEVFSAQQNEAYEVRWSF